MAGDGGSHRAGPEYGHLPDPMRHAGLPILSVELSVQRLDSLSYPQQVDLESALDLSVLLFPAPRYLVEAPAPRIRPLPLPLHVPLLLKPPEQGVDRVRRDAHGPRTDLSYLPHDGVPVCRLLPHDVQNEQPKDIPRLDLAQEDVLGRRPLHRSPRRFSQCSRYPLIENLSKLIITRIISLRNGSGPFRVGIRRVQAKEEWNDRRRHPVIGDRLLPARRAVHRRGAYDPGQGQGFR